MGNLERVKRRLLSEAVAENLDTMRGFGPWSLRRGTAREWQLLIRRAATVVLPAALLTTSYLATSFTPRAAASSRQGISAAVTPPAVMSQLPAAMPQPAGVLPDTRMFAPPRALDPAVLPLEIHHIVLDAGHGGNDPGTLSTTNLAEKDVTLDVVLRLKKLLEASSFRVSLTRDHDQKVQLKERARLANASDADIFVSVHVNSLQSGSSRGVETYYLGATNDPLLNRLAAAENQESGYSLSDFRKLLEGIYADVRSDESKHLAELVQGEMYHRVNGVNPNVENWGVRRAPFLVLVATDMPAILAEVSCMSNPDEARLLLNPDYRQKIAEALAIGIRSYANTHSGSKQKGT